MPGNLPSWYTPEQPVAPVAQQPVQGAAPAALPSWYTPEPVAAAEPQAHPYLDAAKDVVENAATGLAKVPGVVIGTPHFIGHTANWAKAQLFNGLDAVTGGKGGHTGAEQDAQDPVMQVLPSAEGVDKALFKGASLATGHDVTPYEPTSVLGKLFQAGVTGAATGGRSIPGALKNAVAAMAANGTQQAFPDSPGMAALAALVAHTGAGTAARGAKAAYTGTLPLTRPTLAASKVAGRALANVDNTQPGMAAPTTQELTAAEANTAAATRDIPHGLDNYDAGGVIREGLQGRVDKLKADRGVAADDAYGTFKGQPPMPGSEIAPFMSSPAFRNAVKAASTGRLNRGQEPLTTLFKFDEANAGEPTLIPHAAVPPDVLQRIKGSLDDAIAGAKGNVERGDLTDLRSRYVAAIDARYPQTYPTTRAEFAANSRPLDPLETGPNARVLNGDTNFGNRTYTVPQDKVVGAYLQGGSTSRASFQNLIDGFGGNRKLALQAIEDNLANKVQGAVQGDGTLSLDAFNRAIKPHVGALNMWFPELAQKFKTAEASQKSLETLRGQDTLAQSVREGALRHEGTITADSAQAWLTKNAKALDKTQAPAAVMRMKQIAAALPRAPTAAAEAVVEGAPAAVGFGLGGAESGIFGSMFHAIPKAVAGPSFAKFHAAYSEAIERAFSDPMYAQRLSKGINMRPNGMTTTQALGNAVAADLKAGLLATPTATIAGGASR